MNEAFVNEAQLADWLTDLRLPRIRDRLPGLLDEAAARNCRCGIWSCSCAAPNWPVVGGTGRCCA